MYVDRARQLSILAFLLVLGLALLAYAPSFFQPGNLRDISVNASYLFVAAVGMMLVILTGHIDLSVGAILAICSTAAALASKAGWPLFAVFPLALGLGGALGFLNGLLITNLRIHSIIVTLGTMNIFRGALIYWTQGAWIYDLPSDFRTVGLGQFASIPYPVWGAIVTFALFAWVLTQTSWGRSLYAAGSNPSGAHLSGISIPKVVLGAFVVNGVLVGLSAVLFSTRFSAIQSNIGYGFELLVITTVVVGGVHIFGGSGTLLGVALAALLLSTIGTALTFFRVSSYWELTLQGLFVLGAVALDIMRTRRSLQRGEV
jgi:rhamnose transport system permease protein